MEKHYYLIDTNYIGKKFVLEEDYEKLEKLYNEKKKENEELKKQNEELMKVIERENEEPKKTK